MALPLTGKAHEARASLDFVWFVYGSSLDRAALAEWAAGHGYKIPDLSRARPARLHGFRLVFDVFSRHFGGAVASLEEKEGEWVEGLAAPMPGTARGLVDHKEGAVSGLFEPFPVTVRDRDGRELSAIAYRAAPGRRLPAEAAPAPAYLEVLWRGASESGLSAEWLTRLAHLSEGASSPGLGL
ncbi:MAG TPA: gamma-glutamylcyclotransferase family protein [Anaeromyxobacter sp.]|nr:gamma-glutamylcyclotransferase family protein [Anaeromyxobacter sp.]